MMYMFLFLVLYLLIGFVISYFTLFFVHSHGYTLSYTSVVLIALGWSWLLVVFLKKLFVELVAVYIGKVGDAV